MPVIAVRAEVPLDPEAACRRLEALGPRLEGEAFQMTAASEGAGVVRSFAIRFRGGVVRWRQRETEVTATPEIAFEQESGDFDRLAGAWRFHPAPGGCEVRWELDFALGVPMFDRILEPLLARVIIESMREVLAAAFDGAEAVAEPDAVPEAERRVLAAAR